MVDEAHSLGILGKTGKGLFEMAEVDPKRVDIWLGTLSKTLVSCGGYVAGKRSLVEYLKLAAPGMVYSVGMPAPAAIAALTAIGLMRREPERVARLQANGQLFLSKAREAGLNVGESWGYAVTPVILGDSLRTVLLAERLLARGYNAFPIVPPGVPEQSARLRFFISSEHSAEEIEGAVAATREELTKLEKEGVSFATMAKLMKARLTS
jgi:7-keto-8-aminopelargonate synthetase-like enzyme